MGAGIIYSAIMVFVSAIMIGIGIFQIKSAEPVGFYSGETPPKREELTDVAEWNKKHGTMWVVYGIVIMFSGFIGASIGNSIWSIIPMGGGLIIPIIFMILYHNKLKKEYMR